MPSFNYNYNYYIGSRLPRTGNRFAGIYAYSGDYQEICYREYLQTKLIEPLQQGEVYCAEAFVSRAQSPYFASNGLGFYFSKNKVEQGNYENLQFTPQIVYNQIITDTINWVEISGTFEATAAADYLIFGNFYDDPETQAVPTKVIPGAYYQFSYYFVDDVSIEKMPYDKFLFSGITTICQGDSIEILANAGVKNVTWTSLADTTIIISNTPWLKDKPLSTSSYRVTAKGCKKKIIDTVTVTVINLPIIDLGSDTTLCAGTTLTLDGGEHHTYTWQDNSTDRYFYVLDPGDYRVKVTNTFGCQSIDSLSVYYNHAPQIDLGKDLLNCDNDFILLHAGPGQKKYEWSTGVKDSVYAPSSPGQYWVRVENQCGVSSDTITIHSLDDLFIPNVLTVNSDDTLNRYFTIKGIGSDTYGRLVLYNRWGQQIYADDNYKNDWPADPDRIPSETYYYTLAYPNCPSRKGWLKVIK